LPAPDEDCHFAGGKAGKRETAAPRDGVGTVRTEFVGVEAGDLNDLDTSDKGLTLPAQQGGRGAAKQEEARRIGDPIGQHAQNGKNIGCTLNFVDDHQPGQRRHRRHRLGQPRRGKRVFKVEVAGGVGGDKSSRQSGFADLALAGQDDDATARQRSLDKAMQGMTIEQGEFIP